MIADGRPELRAFVAWQSEFTAAYSSTIKAFADAGDDVGLEHSVKKLIEYTKAIASSTRDLLKENQTAEAEKSAGAS